MSPSQTKVARGSAVSHTTVYFLAVGAAVLLFTTIALARHPFIVWVDGLMQRIDPKYREVAIWDYQGGRST
jgi:hypothetical protein